jgi:Flp pilus assembly pilin Flp
VANAHGARGIPANSYVAEVNDSMNSVRMLFFNDHGQGLVEYALIIGLVSIVAVAVLSVIGSKTNNELNNVSLQLGIGN